MRPLALVAKRRAPRNATGLASAIFEPAPRPRARAQDYVRPPARARRRASSHAPRRSYFGSIPHAELLRSAARRIVDRRVLHLLKMWRECPVEETDDRGRKTRTAKVRDSLSRIQQHDLVALQCTGNRRWRTRRRAPRKEKDDDLAQTLKSAAHQRHYGGHGIIGRSKRDGGNCGVTHCDPSLLKQGSPVDWMRLSAKSSRTCDVRLAAMPLLGAATCLTPARAPPPPAGRSG
ncbi:hypothetical protein CIT25_00445 [Mesorhizobium mediterraneum]|uniref:Uncharacterized protein n=1 Tax=Mesorhizobium mediterraneum TaxID=43617 RepID=A0AB36RH47_9HYPH|nr:hypothetical protein CIT25_00445 [Mesorhizobium mediterraneum]